MRNYSRTSRAIKCLRAAQGQHVTNGKKATSSEEVDPGMKGENSQPMEIPKPNQQRRKEELIAFNRSDFPTCQNPPCQQNKKYRNQLIEQKTQTCRISDKRILSIIPADKERFARKIIRAEYRKGSILNEANIKNSIDHTERWQIIIGFIEIKRDDPKES
jgi:hypothetical protein